MENMYKYLMDRYLEEGYTRTIREISHYRDGGSIGITVYGYGEFVILSPDRTVITIFPKEAIKGVERETQIRPATDDDLKFFTAYIKQYKYQLEQEALFWNDKANKLREMTKS